MTRLRERNQARSRENEKEHVSVVILLKNDSTNRNYWKLAKVEELIFSADGRTRAAVVKVVSSTNRPVYLRRVVQHLIAIEVKCLNEIAGCEDSLRGKRVNDNQGPRRNAAVVGEINRREMNPS